MKVRGDDLRRQIARGDQKAFAEFYYGYQDRVAKHAFRIVKDREQTKEIVQDVFVRLWQKHHLFVDIADLEAYVFMVDRKSTRLNSSHVKISYAVFCLKKKNEPHRAGSK